jgi:hypothetical protein
MGFAALNPSYALFTDLPAQVRLARVSNDAMEAVSPQAPLLSRRLDFPWSRTWRE